MAKPKIRSYARKIESATRAFDEVIETANLAKVRNNLRQLGVHIRKREEHRRNLETLGVIKGYVQFKNEKYMVIYTEQLNGKREREYIGADLEHQKLALDAIERYDEWVKVDHEINRLQGRCHRITMQLEDLQKKR